MSTTVERRSEPAPARPKEGWIRWFEDLSAADTDLVGGKGANLGELTSFGIPVPPGFVITAEAFEAFLERSGLRREILDQVEALDVDDTEALTRAAAELQRKVQDAPLPEELARAVASAYRELSRRCEAEQPFTAVRSSATAEDMPGTSFAGMNETFLNVRGDEDLLDAARRCWMSLYGARVLFYRRKQGIAEEKMAIAVVVQAMIDSEAAGVMFTVNPANGDRRVLVIEGAFGLGDTVVSGSVSPDHWEVSKDTLEITRERLAVKHVMAFRDESGRNQRRELSPEEARRSCLPHGVVKEIARLGRSIEEHYGTPQDIEWAVVDGRVSIVQSRPVTAMGEEAGAEAEPGGGEVLVRGLGASPGSACGTARLLQSLADAGRLQPGDVLVTRKTEPDWVPLMKKASAIVTDEGGMTAHAAIVSRELGIPCVVGTQEATRRIPDGTVVTVDAREGTVYRGRREAARPRREREDGAAVAAPAAPVTATRLYVNLGQPELAEKVAAQDVDGVGLLRIEFMVSSITGNTHPRKLIQEGRGGEFRDGLADHLARFARAFAPRPVVARATDFRTNEYREMTGGAEFEPEEANPMIGYRGAYRYIREPDLFRLELEAFRAVREEHRLPNLVLMLPFVRTLSELRACRRLMEEVGLADGYWVMAEVPSILYRLADYVKEGVTGVSIGSNDLTQLMLGIDRDSETMAPEFDERDPAVMAAIRDIVKGCREAGITCSICGQAPSVYPEITEKLVEWGIDSISVNPDVLPQTRRIIAAAEQRLLLSAARRPPA
jgi:pyruvate,water dikinase